MKNKSYLSDAISRFATSSATAIKRFTAVCILLLFFDALAWGVSFTFNGVNYTTSGNTASPSYGGAGDIVIPGTVEHEGITYNVATYIPNQAFFQQWFNSVILPEGVTGIAYQTFVSRQALDFMSIPHSMAVASQYANVRSSIYTLEIRCNDPSYFPPNDGVAFANKNSFQRLVVPKGKVAAYQAHSYWSQFGNKIVESSLFPNSLYFGANQGQGLTVEVTSTTNWTVTTNQSSWIHTNTTSGSGYGTFTVTVDPNGSSGTRKGIITVMNANGIVKQTVSITQYHPSVSVISASPDSLDFAANGTQTLNVEVVSDTTWTVSTNQCEWLTTDTTSGSGNGTFTVTAAPNTSNGVRESAITITDAKGVTKQIAVTQDWSFIEVNNIRYGRLNPATPADSSLCVAGLLGGAKYRGAITIPATVLYRGGAYTVIAIADTAFLDSPGLISVSIPDYVSDIMANGTGGPAFAGCDSLTSIVVAANNPAYASDGGVLFDKLKQTLIHYPRAKTSSHYTIPASVTTIGMEAFESCDSLVSVTLPTSLTNAGGWSINNCPRLAYVEVGWKYNIPTLPSVDAPWFEGDAERCTLIVPPNTVALYEAVDMWSDFMTIKEKISPDTVSLRANDLLSDTVEVTTRVPWHAVEKSAWITVDSLSPTDSSGRFAITADPNPGFKRSGEVEFSNQTPNGTNDTILVQVVQAANLTLIASADSLFFNAYNAQDSIITVTAYSDWTVAQDTSWIILGPASPSGSATGTFTVRTEDNDSIMREGHITITKGDSTKTIVVTQYANPCLNVSADSLFFDAYDSQDSIITVTAYSEWTVVRDTSWIILEPATPPYGDIPGTFTVRTEDNDSIMREGHITITNGDSVKTIVVVQTANPTFIVSADSIFFDAYDSQDTIITVTAYSEWTVVKDTSWIILDPESPPYDSIPGTFTVRTEDNDSIMREGHITITKGDSVKTIVVTQYANPYINVSADTLFFDASDSQDTTITVTAYSDWTVAKDTSWIILDPASPFGSIPGTFTVKTVDNDSTAREGRITITKGDSVRTIVVVQATNPCLNISADSLFFDAYGAQDTTITVTAYSDWTVVKDTSWIVLGPASSPYGDIPGTFTVRTEDNDSIMREGHITITKGDAVKTIVVTQYANPYINVSADSLFFDAYDSQDTIITVTAYSDWTVVKDTSWIVLGPKSLPPGSATGTFTVRTEDNDSIVREGRITITKGDSVKTIVVTQAANPYISVSADSLFFDAYGAQDTTVTVTAYSDWTVEKDTSWIILTPEDHHDNIPGTFTVRTEDNDSIMREGHITITKGDAVKTIVVTQYANPTFIVSAPDSLFFDAYGAQDSTITVTAYSEWTVEKDTSWIILTPEDPHDNIPETFTVRTEDNDSIMREGHITITKGDAVKTIVVVQAANPTFIVSAPDSLFFDAYDAQDSIITVTAYSDWTVVKDTSWIVLGPKSLPPGSATGTFTVRTEDNDSIMREGRITITKGDSVKTIVVTQAANPYISVSADSLFFDAYGAQDTTVTVTTYSDWTVAKDTSWIILTPEDPHDNIPGTFTVRTEDNDSIVREGRITITKGDAVKTIVVTQYANPYINVSADSLFFDAYDSQDSIITVTAYSDWTVEKDTSWIVLGPKSLPPGSATGTFTVRTEDNDSIVREGRITITKGDAVKTIVVTQYANPTFIVSAPDSLFFDADDAQDSIITVTAYSDWTVVKDTSWIVLGPKSLPPGSATGTFTVRTEDNDSIMREGHITITKGDSIRTIVVVQAANPYISVSADSLFFDAYDSQNSTVTVTAYSDWTVEKDTSWIILTPEDPHDNIPETFTVRTEDNDSIMREGHITVTKGDAVKTIVVTQAANPHIGVSADILFFEAYDSPDTVITVTAYSDWDITIVPATADEWLKLDHVSGSGSGTFTVSVEPNDSTERTANIRITNGNTIIIIPVTQAANPSINLSTYNIDFGATSNREATIEVAAYTEWIVSVSADAAEWLKVSRESGSGRETFIASATANDRTFQRNGTITVSNRTTSHTIHVTQAGLPPILSLSPDVLYFEPTVYLVDTVIVASNIDWTVSEITGEDATWFTVNHSNDTLTITVQLNAGDAARSGMIIITGEGEYSMLKDTVHIVQEALLINLPTQSVSFGPEINLSQLVSIGSNAAWELTLNDYWITLDASSGYRDGTFTVTVAPGYFADREGWITVVSAGKEVGSIKVVQTGPQIITTPENIYFEAEPYENALLRQTVQVTANISIVKAAVEYDDDDENEWLTVGLTADYGRHYEVIAQPNTGAGREASIVFSNSSKTKNVTLRVSQAPIQDISLSEDSLFLEADEVVPASIGVKSYTDWNVSIVGGSDWLSVYPPFGSGEESFSVMATTNEDAEVRTASIIVANNYKSDTLHITQAAHLDYSLRFEADGVHYYTPDFNNVDVEVVAPETGAYRGKVVIPSTVPYLANIYIVKAIGEEAFAGSDITAVKLPVSLDSVGTDAFKACDKLDSVEVEWTFIDYAYPKGITEAFEQVQQNEVTLIVPVGTKTYYQGAEFWRAFHIVEKGETPETPTGIAKAAESVAVRAASGRLYVDSPAAETVYVYSFTGKLLNAATKDSGRATLDIPQERLLIIRGSSGWARKLTVN